MIHMTIVQLLWNSLKPDERIDNQLSGVDFAVAPV